MSLDISIVIEESALKEREVSIPQVCNTYLHYKASSESSEFK